MATTLLRARADGGDLERRVGLAVAGLAAVALAALVLEDDDLFREPLLHDLRLDRDARDRRTAHLDLAAVVGEQQRTEGHLRPGWTVELLHAQGLPLAHAVLFSPCCDDGVHGSRGLQASGVV